MAPPSRLRPGRRLARVLILLPPSEGKTAPVRGARLDLDRLSLPALTDARATVLEALIDLCAGNAGDPSPDETDRIEAAAEVLGLGPRQLDEVRRNAALATAPTARADRVYTGVLYEALGFATLPAAAKRRATRRVLITSALFGLLRPDDPIPAYRLAGDVTVPGIGPVAAHWRRHLPAVMLEAAGSGPIIDLRSGTYTAFWRPADHAVDRVATVRVLHEVDGRRKVVSHFNKATKGRVVRDLMIDAGTPRTVAGLVTQLRDLGWYVEDAGHGRTGHRLDIIVRDL